MLCLRTNLYLCLFVQVFFEVYGEFSLSLVNNCKFDSLLDVSFSMAARDLNLVFPENKLVMWCTLSMLGILLVIPLANGRVSTAYHGRWSSVNGVDCLVMVDWDDGLPRHTTCHARLQHLRRSWGSSNFLRNSSLWFFIILASLSLTCMFRCRQSSADTCSRKQQLFYSQHATASSVIRSESSTDTVEPSGAFEWEKSSEVVEDAVSWIVGYRWRK